MMDIKGHQQQDYHKKCTRNRIFTEVHRDRTDKCIRNRKGKYGRNRTDTEVHQKQDREVHQKQDSYISAQVHQKDDKHRRAPETGQLQKCTRNRTGNCTRNRTNTKVHWKVNKHMSAPEMGQRQKCTSNRTNRKVHQKKAPAPVLRRSPATGLSQKVHQKQDIYRNAKRQDREVCQNR